MFYPVFIEINFYYLSIYFRIINLSFLIYRIPIIRHKLHRENYSYYNGCFINDSHNFVMTFYYFIP